MEARELNRVMQLPRQKRVPVIAEGLGLLAEHVQTLREDLTHLGEAERPRAFAVVASHSDEEAAKVLILLDLVRMGWRDQRAAHRQVQRFYDHLARCIYAEVADMRPATLREIRSMVAFLRQPLYLDGPNDVDWIFRNQLLATREEALYVDYIHDEENDRWVTPATHDSLKFGYITPLSDLVVSMHRVGLTTSAGLDITAAAWADTEIEDNTHWQEVRALNRHIVEELFAQELVLLDCTPDDAHRVIDRWTFPLHDVDMSPGTVTLGDLRAERDRRLGELHYG